MSRHRSSVQLVAHHLALAAEPLIEAGRSLGDFRRLMARLGFTAGTTPPAFQSLSTAAERALAALEALPDDPDPKDVFALSNEVKGLFDALFNLASSAPPTGVDPSAYAAEIGDRLVELIVTDYLAANGATLSGLLQALNVIQVEVHPPSAGRPSYARSSFRWAEIPKIITDMPRLMQRAFKWGASDFDAELILESVGDFFLGLGFPIAVEQPDHEAIRAYSDAPPDRGAITPLRLKIPFYHENLAGAEISAAAALRILPPAGPELPGIALELQLPTGLTREIRLQPWAKMRLLAGTNSSGLLALVMRPGGVKLKFPEAAGATPVTGRLGLGFDLSPDEPMLILGDRKGPRLEFGGASIDLGLHIGGSEVAATFGADLHDVHLVLNGDDADGFLASLLGRGPSRIGLPLGLEWGKPGLRFKGSASFEIGAAPHIALGPVHVDSITLRLAAASGSAPNLLIELGTGISGSFGPLDFVVEGAGIQSNIFFRKGNLGPLDLTVGFKPPTGAGLSVDAGLIKGGGYLSFDRLREEYAGALELEIAGIVTVKAVGIISTRMPDGTKGFSLLLIITAEFGTGIQLGFGFTLLGVGGLLGLNRTMRLDYLAGAMRTGALDNVLFPKDVIANAPRIISDLRQAFPAAPDRLLVGPMAKFGWGTPPIVSLSVGVVIEIPGNIAILGVLRIALPAEDVPLIVIQAAFIGAIEFDKNRIWFYATLYDSRILFATIDGDMGLLIDYGDEGEVLVSVGGFHPSFDPPALPFPPLSRISLSIIDESFAKIRVESYQAITSNTIQFGARAEMAFGFDSFRIEGHTAFDALIQRSPFKFIVEGSSGVSLRAFGVGVFSIRLQYRLEGPRPYRVRGQGHISLLFFELSADFDVSFGDPLDTLLDAIAALPLLETELGKSENWRALPVSGAKTLVTLRAVESGGADFAVHPLGTMRVSQRAMPLDGKLDRIGAQAISDAESFSIDIISTGLAKGDPVDEQFALAQFENLSDADKLSRPSFQKRPGGADFAPSGPRFSSGPSTHRAARYEETTIDTFYTTQQRRFLLPIWALFVHGLKANSAALSGLSLETEQAREPFEEKIVKQPPAFAVVSATDNSLFAADAQFASEAAAQAYARARMAENPEVAAALHVVPSFEARLAA